MSDTNAPRPQGSTISDPLTSANEKDKHGRLLQTFPGKELADFHFWWVFISNIRAGVAFRCKFKHSFDVKNATTKYIKTELLSR
ncbi:hypothetical protein Pdw03_3173 [Penicillium digitatum]|uniref:Uncharacterized protein n=1 Tax=Penicillium digitatum TaxID=36651 RepID=A0A7T6XFR0_PENDI|nr:hypothetical protein Pdw03_3173 [Penicillium digitatum]